ncbi:hypothetical protein CXF68_06370 [Tenacibaculum sp. Bg11-29]|uniref:hypothetical protein n=1 Tax=Tenacibaculum sp. Bg11-29 TaxID=2058306 RepID=UPI000C325D6B|nr:hypothetical protein [Tenacibaculum sp. Bg11-29]PKH50347.1 hypothetical protein CXF68_06370 [Tenacibaculum sp. Bg11-29]
MDSETGRIFTSISTVIMLVILTTLIFASANYLTILLVIYAVIGIGLSVLGGILLSWGKQYNPANSLICCLIFCFAPFLVAYAINYGVIIPLQKNGLLTLINSVLFFSTIALIVLYIKYWNQYLWKAYVIEEKNLDATILSINLIGCKNPKPNLLTNRFYSKPDVFDKKRVATKNKLWENQEPQYVGLPQGLEITYYSKKEKQLYKGVFQFKKHSLRKILGTGIFFPITKHQQYNHLNLVLFTKGAFTLQVGNSKNDVTFFEGTCTPITKEELSNSALKKFNKKELKLSTETAISEALDADLAFLRKQQITIKHSITGLTNKIVSVAAITANGERYFLNKHYFKGKTLPKTHAPIVVLYFTILNNKGKTLTWHYLYDIHDIANHLKKLTPNSTHEIDYKFHLTTKEENLLNATSFEFINNKKEEIKLNTAVSGVTLMR